MNSNAFSSPAAYPGTPGYWSMPHALALTFIAIGVDGSFCLFFDYLIGIEGGAMHAARLGPALVLAALICLWLGNSSRNPKRLSVFRLWGGLILTWAAAYTAGLWASTTLGPAEILGVLFVAGALGALATAWIIAPAIPSIFRGGQPLWLMASGGTAGMLGGGAFLALAQGSLIHQLSPGVSAFLLNAVLFLPWTLALAVIVFRSREPASPD